MDKIQSLEMFRKLKVQSALRDWCVAEASRTCKHLFSAADTVVIYRSQGRVQLLQEMIDLMDKPVS